MNFDDELKDYFYFMPSLILVKFYLNFFAFLTNLLSLSQVMGRDEVRD